jgi:hypothetical protein
MQQDGSLVHAFACRLVALQASLGSPEALRHKHFLSYLQRKHLPLEAGEMTAANLRHAAIIIVDWRDAWGFRQSWLDTAAWMAESGYPMAENDDIVLRAS